jgi:hypothetical protein
MPTQTTEQVIQQMVAETVRDIVKGDYYSIGELAQMRLSLLEIAIMIIY